MNKNVLLIGMLIAGCHALAGENLFTVTGDIISDTGRVAGAPFRALGNDMDDEDDMNIISSPAYLTEGVADIAAEPFYIVGDKERDNEDNE